MGNIISQVALLSQTLDTHYNIIITMKKIIIAIDGHSSCGKSTMAKALAKAIGYIYIDTGAMYRAVTLYALRNDIIDKHNVMDEEKLRKDLGKISIYFKLNEQTGTPETYLNGENVEKEIRGIRVSGAVSPIATLDFVRSFLVKQQQEMGKDKGIVMDGRDIGTVVFPQAELKIFVTAQPEVRAKRRYDELVAKGEPVVLEDILQNVKQRDFIDSNRETAPLRQAEDAILVDNSLMTIDEQNAKLLQLYNERMQNLK